MRFGVILDAVGHTRCRISPFCNAPVKLLLLLLSRFGELGESQTWEEKVQSHLGDLDENACKKKKKGKKGLSC